MSINTSTYILTKIFTTKDNQKEYEAIIGTFSTYLDRTTKANEIFLNKVIELIQRKNKGEKSEDINTQIQRLKELDSSVKYIIIFDKDGYIREFYPSKHDVLNLYLGNTAMFKNIEKAILTGPHVFLVDRHSYYAQSKKFGDMYALILIDVTNFNDYLKKMHNWEYVSFIVDEKGSIIAHYEEALVNEGANIKMFISDLYKINETKEPMVFIVKGEKHFLYSKYLPNIDKYIFIGNKYSQAFAGYNIFKEQLLWLGIFLTFLALVVSLLASSQLQKPFSELFRLVSDIKNQNYNVNVKKTFFHEFNNFAESIVEMGKTILDREEKLSKLFKTSRDAIIISNLDGKVLDINPFGLKMYGYEDSSQIKNFSELFYDSQEFSRLIDQLIKKGYIETYECKAKRSDGISFYTLFSSSLIGDEKNNPLYLISIVKDITDKVNMQERLFQAEKMESIGRLAGSIAHDLNNMLTVISSNNQLIKLYNKDNEKINKYIDGITIAVDKTKDFIKSLLSFSKRQVYELKTVDINEAIKEEIKLLKPTIREDINLEVGLFSETLYVKLDRTQFTQLLLNLVVNAVEAMPEGGIIKIGVERKIIDRKTAMIYSRVREGDFVCINFSDTGKGIPEEIRDKIFDPFFTTKEYGTGLGLATVYSIVEQHEGFINVYSEVGVGTTFKIYLPLTEGKTETFDAKIEEVELEKKRILLIEDKDDVRADIEELLKTHGFEVYSFSNSVELIENFDKYREKFDICLSDIIMPKIGGLELYRKLKQLKPDVKFLFMTGYADNIEQVNGLIKEGLKVLSKPFSIKEFFEKLREIK